MYHNKANRVFLSYITYVLLMRISKTYPLPSVSLLLLFVVLKCNHTEILKHYVPCYSNIIQLWSDVVTVLFCFLNEGKPYTNSHMWLTKWKNKYFMHIFFNLKRGVCVAFAYLQLLWKILMGYCNIHSH